MLAIAIVMIIATLMYPASFYAESSSFDAHAEQLVYDYYSLIDQGNWHSWAMMYAPSLQDGYLNFVSNEENVTSGLGITSITNAEVLNVAFVGDNSRSCLFGDTSVDDLLLTSENYYMFKVTVDFEVRGTSAYFDDGITDRLIIVVENDNAFYLAVDCNYFLDSDLISTDSEENNGGNAKGQTSEDHQTITTAFHNINPTIKVKSSNVVHTVSIYDFVINVACNEFGNMNYDDDAKIANIIAIKMCGWYAMFTDLHGSTEFDIYGVGNPGHTAMVAYNHNSLNGCTSANKAKIETLVNNYMDRYMLTSSGKLFFPNYEAGSANANGKGQGCMYQNGSNYLATNSSYNYSWSKILHYYYDNSEELDGSIGVVQIKKCSHSVVSTTYCSTLYKHWHPCLKCATKQNVSDHTWVDYATYFKCSVCGRKETDVAANSIFFYKFACLTY